MTQEIKVDSLDELEAWASDWAQSLSPQSLVLLQGPVGAGKTQLVRFASLALGANPQEIASPSYGIIHSYRLKDHSELSSLDHVDLYRLQDEEDLESTGFWDLFSNDESLIFIEWAERLSAGALPKSWKKIEIRIEVFTATKRKIFIR